MANCWSAASASCCCRGWRWYCLSWCTRSGCCNSSCGCGRLSRVSAAAAGNRRSGPRNRTRAHRARPARRHRLDASHGQAAGRPPRKQQPYPESASLLALLKEILGNSVQDVRGLSHSLYPAALDRFGLAEALQHLADVSPKPAPYPWSWPLSIRSPYPSPRS
ncbi:MAG: hypothetical protein WKG07_21020 [Hymenobacter sp.]